MQPWWKASHSIDIYTDLQCCATKWFFDEGHAYHCTGDTHLAFIISRALPHEQAWLLRLGRVQAMLSYASDEHCHLGYSSPLLSFKNGQQYSLSLRHWCMHALSYQIKPLCAVALYPIFVLRQCTHYGGDPPEPMSIQNLGYPLQSVSVLRTPERLGTSLHTNVTVHYGTGVSLRVGH